MNFPGWTPVPFRQDCEERLAQQIGVPRNTRGGLRSIGYQSEREFHEEQRKKNDALSRIASNPDMEAAWRWLIEKHPVGLLPASAAIRNLVDQIFWDWRLIVKRPKADRKAALQRVGRQAKKLSFLVAEFEAENDSPINQIEMLLRGHEWTSTHPLTRENVYSLNGGHKMPIRLAALIEEAKAAPAPSVLLTNLSNAAYIAADRVSSIKARMPDKMTPRLAAWRTFVVRSLDHFLRLQWRCVPPLSVMSALTRAMTGEDIDESHVNKLRRPQRKIRR